MSNYLARVEHINEFYNIRPVMELLEDGFVEVEESKFGQYGTITIGALYGQYSESPLIQDEKYVIFNLEDAYLDSLDKTYSGYRIKAADFISRAKSLDTYRIREVIEIPSKYEFKDYYVWKHEAISDIMPPITNVVYLSNKVKIMGPFTWKELSGNVYQFLPCTMGEDAFMLNSYNINAFEEPIYEFDASKRTFDMYYGKTRHILEVSSLPEVEEKIDCIDDDSLKELASKILSTSVDAKKNQKEVKNALMSLSSTEMTETRKQRLLDMFKNGEMIDKVMGSIPLVILENRDSMEKIAQAILDNSNYSDKIYSVIKSQEGFANIYSKLEQDKKSKQLELDELQNKVNELKNLVEKEGIINDKELEYLEEENNKLKLRLSEYKKYDDLQAEVNNLKSKKEGLEGDYSQLLRMKNSISEEIEKKVSEAYTNLAFDGAVSSMMMQEAAKFEKKIKNKNINSQIAAKNNIRNVSAILEPKDLTEFVYNELNGKAKRSISRNDVANIILCFAQGFLSILAGEPGSGKTSLVSLIAHILGLSNSGCNRYEEIAVEKGWTSRRDFIGYYNPLTKSFDAANKGMLRALEIMKAEAENKIADFPYFVLLDEANLSQMEYYWADFMSLCDFDKKRREISLGEEYTYPISNTLRFVATINLDHTTEILSPRLIDRAWVIMLHASDVLIDEFEEMGNLEEYPIVPYACFDKLCNLDIWETKSLDIAIVDKFNRIRTCFQSIGINFSPRTIGMIKKYCIISRYIMDYADNVYVALDYSVAQKILPQINGYGENYSDFLNRLLLECDQNTMPRCHELILAILKKGNLNMQYYQFFAR